MLCTHQPTCQKNAGMTNAEITTLATINQTLANATDVLQHLSAYRRGNMCRRVTAYAMRQHTALSLKEIGNAMGLSSGCHNYYMGALHYVQQHNLLATAESTLFTELYTRCCAALNPNPQHAVCTAAQV